MNSYICCYATVVYRNGIITLLAKGIGMNLNWSQNRCMYVMTSDKKATDCQIVTWLDLMNALFNNPTYHFCSGLQCHLMAIQSTINRTIQSTIIKRLIRSMILHAISWSKRFIKWFCDWTDAWIFKWSSEWFNEPFDEQSDERFNKLFNERFD